MYKILLIEDDLSLSKNISINIKKWDYEIKTIENFQNILEEFIEYKPDLVLLDITLPYFDGFYWCKKIRDISKVPIIFLSSRDSNMDIIMAVNMGADDFIKKPFSTEILLAKIQAILRRAYSYSDELSDIIEVNSAILNISDSTITYGNNSKELTKNEFKILQILMKNNGHIVSRDNLMRFLWDSEYYISENTLTVNINRLRKSLEDIGLIDFIITKKSQGYMIK
ncbi:response regulator transcription factor [Peptoniphilus stercorisuis]|uniref:DNA-binding response OmpR family regulator n=1 Tax=Peptoniphilus stercorisuis TaxID=1436965 RepID=A0ABS4KDT9_9FIRM|nr:response regulator transcription factor [Peptoniphilus stercorisuis]MBP2025922.1 DNA-binding response OmpR family regulator [Peptoniphilus stercorisuis]